MKMESLIAAQAGCAKTDETDPGGGVSGLLALLGAVTEIQPGASILDFGCGVGNGVRTLLAQGFDAQGVDIYEYWGRHADLYWETQPTPPSPEIAARLHVATLEPYRLPLPDACFDHVISAEVFEHVDDRRAVFAEIARVLKPGGVSVHIFPGRWVPLVEGHINVPLSPLCKYPAWLKAMAILGFRSARQKGLPWRKAVATNLEQMNITSYPTRGQYLAWAREAGLDARFAEADYVRRGGTGWQRLHGHIGWPATVAARFVLENMLVLRHATRTINTEPLR